MMNKKAENRFVFIDTETGGTIPTKHSLLQIGVVVWEYRTGILAHKEFHIKHQEYIITKEAQRINKFNLKFYNENAQLPNKVIDELLCFLRDYFDSNTLIPIIGHNIQFDVGFLKEFFKKNNRSFNQYFSHRMIDTYSVYKTLVLSGKIEENLNSSADVFKYFKIRIDNRHSAIEDCLATVELYEKLLEIISK